MTAQQATVVRDGGAWVVKVNGEEVTDRKRAQGSAINEAREWLLANGGGELAVQGKYGRIRHKHTIGRLGPDDSRD